MDSIGYPLRHRLLRHLRILLRDDLIGISKIGPPLRLAKHALARARGRRFLCRALWGSARFHESPAVLSDGSVVCSCRDSMKTIVLGDLARDTLSGIWSGERATALRDSFRRGWLPHALCASCPSLEMVGEELPPPAGTLSCVLVENTSACNLSCVGCPIEAANRARARQQLPLEEWPGLSRQLRAAGVRRVGVYNYGEPFLDKQVAPKLAELRAGLGDDARLITSTNGVLLGDEQRRSAAIAHLDAVIFSIDGCDTPTLSKYQVGGSFEKAYGNMKELVEVRNRSGQRRLTVLWKYVMFDWNCSEERLARAVRLAKEAAIDVLYFTPSSTPPRQICDTALVAWRRRQPLYGYRREEVGFIGHSNPAGEMTLDWLFGE